MDKEVILTRESYEQLNQELEYLSTTVRVEIAQNLKVAAEYGDLRENAEFEAEKDRQVVVEARISNIRSILNKCKVIDNSNDNEKVTIGNVVTLYDYEFEEEIQYKILDSIQADPLEGSISYLSPVGKALMNKSCGDIIVVSLPNNEMKYKIVEII